MKRRSRRTIMDVSNDKLSRRALLVVLVGGVGGAGAASIIPLRAEPALTRGDVILYKDPQCGCCEAYADYLRHNGFKVEAVSTNDLTVMGQKYGIPDDLQPCHISLIGGMLSGVTFPSKSSTGCSPISRKSSGSRCRVCPGGHP